MSEKEEDVRSSSSSNNECDEEEDDELLLNEVSSEKALENLRSLQHNGMTEEEKRCHRMAEQYIQNCLHFHLKVDPSIVIALKTGWDILQPTRHFNDGSMLSLAGILEDNKKIRKMNFANVGMQDAR